MDIQTGTPRTDARYLCFVPHDVKREISKPIVLIWSKGRWCFDESNVEFPRKPVGWVGPLPAGKLTDIIPGASLGPWTGHRHEEAQAWINSAEDLGGCDCSAGYSNALDHARSCPKYQPEYDL